MVRQIPGKVLWDTRSYKFYILNGDLFKVITTRDAY